MQIGIIPVGDSTGTKDWSMHRRRVHIHLTLHQGTSDLYQRLIEEENVITLMFDVLQRDVPLAMRSDHSRNKALLTQTLDTVPGRLAFAFESDG